MWDKGFRIKKEKIKDNKLILKIACGDVYEVHKHHIDSKKLKIDLGDLNKVFLIKNILIYVCGGVTRYSLDGIPKECITAALLYSITLTAAHNGVMNYQVDDLRGKILPTTWNF